MHYSPFSAQLGRSWLLCCLRDVEGLLFVGVDNFSVFYLSPCGRCRLKHLDRILRPVISAVTSARAFAAACDVNQAHALGI